MRIGIIGSGKVGQALGAGFASTGHTVKVGSREPEKLNEWLQQTGKDTSVGTFAETAAFGELIVLAVNWGGVENAIQLLEPKNTTGKIVIDVSNPLDFSSGAPKLAVGFTDSAGESVQRWLPDARVVKAFNTVGAHFMFKPQIAGGPPTLFIAGNDDNAKGTVTEVIQTFGLNAVDLGDITAARLIEPLAIAWITYAVRTGNWMSAVTLLGR